MNYKQNEKINQVKESTLVVGIDIGSTTQYARAFDWRGIELGKVFTFSNNREGFESFNGCNGAKTQKRGTGDMDGRNADAGYRGL